VDTMLHSKRRQFDSSRAWAHRCRHYSVDVVTGGRLDGGNFAGVAMRARSRGRLGEDGLDKRALTVNDDDAERKAGRARVQDGLRHYSNRPTRKKNGPDPFSI
jgi:hypothetical protein